jgi:excisionase family DNA binding protein
MARQVPMRAGVARKDASYRPRADDPRAPAPGVDAYATNEVAYLLRCSSRQVLKMIRSGQLPSFRIGSHIRVSRVALDAFMAAGGTADDEEVAT